MPKIAGESLRKVTLNLFATDVEWCQTEWGPGYTEEIRLILRRYINERKNHE